jgi:hypothetical protein
MNSPFRTRWPLLLTGVVALSWYGAWWFPALRASRAVAAPPAPQGTTVYDPDPQHLWNRLHDAFRSRNEGEEAGDPWELDPFLWRNDKFLAGEKGLQTALDVLDEFIAQNGHTLIKDPLKRALLQRDLWALFDSLYVPRFGAAQKGPEVELASRVARILPRLSLTAAEIKKLPNNYAEAVAARTPPAQPNAERPEAAFLPDDLWEPNGPWVLLGDEVGVPLALTHVHFFGGRSTFFVFLRAGDGREQTLKLLDDLRKRAPDAPPPPLPSGVRVALLRQLQLIDDQGKRVTTNVTESLQMRTPQGVFEIKLSRRALLAGEPSLKAIGADDRERDYLLFMGSNAGAGPSKVLRSCFHCHQGEGIDSVLSYRRFQPLPLTPRVQPTLIASKREEEEKWGRIWKGNRYEWGLLQGLIQNGVRD